LFRALKSANIEDEAAAKAVAVVEEHIDMAVGRAVQPLEQKIAALDGQMKAMHTAFEAKLESGLKGMQTSIDGLKWYIIGLGSLMASAVAIGGTLTAYAQFIK
jgi:hypothetical protein